MRYFLLGMAILIPFHASAQPYSVFNPVPDDQLRDIDTERPNITDSPLTLDAGRVEIDMGLVTGSRDKQDGTKTRDRNFGGDAVLRFGLTPSSEFQIISGGYQFSRTQDDTGKTTQKGLGDTTLRYKYNLWGNDSGETALGVIGFVKLPTNQDNLGNNAVEGGVGIPYSFTLTDSWSVTAETQFSWIKDEVKRDHDMAFANSAVLIKSFNDSTSGFVELYTYRATTAGAQWENTVNVGTVYNVTKNVTLDTAAYVGITDAAADFTWTIGGGYRF